jgi:hypothetical protein
MKPPDWAAFFLASLQTFDGKTLMVRMAKVWTDRAWVSRKVYVFQHVTQAGAAGMG